MWWVVGVVALIVLGLASIRDDSACQSACQNGGGRMASCSREECRCEYPTQGDSR